MKVDCFFLFICIFLLFRNDIVGGESITNDHEHILRYQLRRRHSVLKQTALTSLNQHSPRTSCPKERLQITEYAFGRSGNNLIEFTHGLWLARRLNATLIVPGWMKEIFIPFDTSFIESVFCYTFDITLPKDAQVYEMTSENSFFLFQLKKEFKFPQFIPEIMKIRFSELASQGDSTSSVVDPFMQELSRLFLQVYASLWCCPNKKLLLLSEFYITHFMKGSLSYAAVHKRQLEGGCSKTLASVTKPSDFPAKEIPLSHSDWFAHGPLHKFHPICEMTPSFIQETLLLNHRNTNLSNAFIAFDGRGDISAYEVQHVLFSHYLTDAISNPIAIPPAMAYYNISSHYLHKLQQNIDGKTVKDLLKYLDMLIAIHSEFFILNPRSTFSFQIYVIRVLLGLQSVPIIRDNDVYMQRYPDEFKSNDRSLWVSWVSVLHAAAELV
jgi:hypothetical protein